MKDDKMSKKLENMLNNIDQNKLNQVKNMLGNEQELNAMLNKIDPEKANRALNALGANNVDLGGLINQAKSNPDLIKNFKNKL